MVDVSAGESLEMLSHLLSLGVTGCVHTMQREEGRLILSQYARCGACGHAAAAVAQRCAGDLPCSGGAGSICGSLLWSPVFLTRLISALQSPPAPH